MIVYGDPSYSRTLHELREELETDLERLRAVTGPKSIDELRSLLIAAGQLEQGAEDSPDGIEATLPLIRSITDAVAAAFARHWDRTDGETVLADLDALATLLGQLRSSPDARLTIKVPEGFAFYCLYPEQYCLAAERWARRNAERSSRSVAVVGVRSIGTSLSALVGATLRSLGWEVRRTTVRPTGHPFERRATIDMNGLGRVSSAIVVDEGPGASGSSMAAVAQALADAGMDRQAISFFPGHSGEPGAMASDHVRQWWASTARYVAGANELRWGGKSLLQILADQTHMLFPDASPVQHVDDLSGGLWRRYVYREQTEWPPAFQLFERAKFRCIDQDGRKLLWKFAGLARAADQVTLRSAGAWTVTPLGSAMGFIAIPWVEGTPMRAADATAEFLHQMGQYIVAAAGPRLTASELANGHARLNEMLFSNTRELLGEAYATTARQCADAARDLLKSGAFPAYGDGRMAPVEWIRTTSSHASKVDFFGHDCDHTIIGPQPWLWDLAGAAVECNLGHSAEALLLEKSGIAPNPAKLRTFYRTAYSAFRAALCNVCSGTCGGDADERQRLDQAQAAYRDRLKCELDRFAR